MQGADDVFAGKDINVTGMYYYVAAESLPKTTLGTHWV
jgi:hypothetical protein